MKKLISKMLIIAGMVVFVSCGSEKKEDSQDESMNEETTEEVEEMKPEAMAVISPASGSTMTGTADFMDNGDGTVTLNVNVSGATPGEHALHLHQNGDCSAPDATSAGGHWNPAGTEHGKRMESMAYHAGDIDNMTVGEDSIGTLEMIVQGWSVGGSDSTNVIGKAIIIHALPDDFESQPSGAAGTRVACGVIAEKM